jgi:hypothetical protein
MLSGVVPGGSKRNLENVMMWVEGGGGFMIYTLQEIFLITENEVGGACNIRTSEG